MLEMTTQTDPTTISVEAKARLAKLLATENITVEHRNVPTAMFDIKGRVLILPNWKDITKDIYDLLVLHEVGHALFTPLDGWHGAVSAKGPNYKGFLNITEDARIEKKQKRKFPGGRRSMIAGYKELLARDFFGIKDRDIATFGLIDRLNIHFKVGIAAGVPFSTEEMVWVERMAALETFDDAEALADDLFAAMKSDMPETDTGRGIEGDGAFSDDPSEGEGEEGFGVPDPSNDNDDGSDDSEMGDESPFGDDDADGESDTDGDAPSGDGKGMEDADDSDSDGDGSENGEANDADKADGESDSTDKGDSDPSDASTEEVESENASGDQAGRGGNTSTGAEPFSETDEAFRNKEESLVDDGPDSKAPIYVQVPKDEAFNLDTIIIPNKEVVRALKASAVEYSPSALVTAAKQAKEYRNSNAKVVNYLAKEFEMRKAADASKRTTVAKTGILDTNTLHSFKWNDDIFKKVANVADGKSHGLQLFVDWSGSMSQNMFGTMDQVLNLVLFCKKVGIPFDVYAFTDGYNRQYYYEDNLPKPSPMVKDKLETGDLEFRKTNFNLLQIATSQGNRAAFNDMLQGLIILRGNFNHAGKWANDSDSDVTWYNIDRRYGLCGTPLNEAIMTSIPVINRFREANGLQIVNSVFLTDGEGCNVYQAHNCDGFGRFGPRGGKTIIRDRKSRKEFLQNDYDRSGDQMSILLEIVRIRTGAKVVNFYVANSYAQAFKNEWMSIAPKKVNEYGYDRDDIDGSVAAYKIAKADGGVIIEDSTHGWDAHYMILGGSALGVHGDEGLDDSLVGAKKGKLKTAFGKASSGKLRNRVVLRKFTELIAA